MLISPCNAVHTCLMRAPIDVVFLDRDGVVLAVRERLAPWRFAQCLRARHTLELAAGAIAALGLRAGERLRWSVAAPAPARHSAAAVVLLALLVGACAGPAPKGQGETLALLGQADAAYAKSDWTVAEKHYRALAERVPNDTYAQFRLANSLARQDRLSEAAQQYYRVLARDPAYTKAHYNLAVIHLLEAERRLEDLQAAARPEDPLLPQARALRKTLDRAAIVYAETASPIPRAGLAARKKPASSEALR
jgi:tetratricopeptide (TPR) repeat protein